jgi:folate-binding protein YgfZ
MLTKAHFGDPMIEQRKLAEGEAVCLLDPKGVIAVSGEDRLSWLHSLLSQNLKNLAPGESAEALLLDPQGRIEQVIKVIDDGETTWLMVDQSHTEALLNWLGKMVFRMKVEITNRSDQFATIGSVKEISEISFASNQHPLVWKDQWPGAVAGGHRYSVRSVQYSWFEHLVPVEGLEQRLSGKVLAGTMAADGLRVAAGRPKAINEVDDKSLPHELDLLSTAVHLSKGCYRGQESVAKVHNLGHPPRRLTFLHLDGSEHALPDIGDEIKVLGEEKVRGKITSVAQHFEMGPIALAVISRSVPEDAALEVSGKHGSIAATQEVIVPQSAGSVANIPKLPKLNLGARAK